MGVVVVKERKEKRREDHIFYIFFIIIFFFATVDFVNGTYCLPTTLVLMMHLMTVKLLTVL